MARNRSKAMEVAVRMAQLDFETNGAYLNAPYSVRDENGVYLKARVRSVDSAAEVASLPRPVHHASLIRLELYQPEQVVESRTIQSPDVDRPEQATS